MSKNKVSVSLAAIFVVTAAGFLPAKSHASGDDSNSTYQSSSADLKLKYLLAKINATDKETYWIYNYMQERNNPYLESVAFVAAGAPVYLYSYLKRHETYHTKLVMLEGGKGKLTAEQLSWLESQYPKLGTTDVSYKNFVSRPAFINGLAAGLAIAGAHAIADSERYVHFARLSRMSDEQIILEFQRLNDVRNDLLTEFNKVQASK